MNKNLPFLSLKKCVPFIMSLVAIFVIGTSTFAQTDVTLNIAISQDEDAVEENLIDNSIDFSSSDLELGSENDASTDAQRVGVRFRGIDLPSNATINSAYIQFTVDENGKNEDPCVQTIYFEDVANAAAFTSNSGDLTGRTVSETTLEWTVTEGSWGEVGVAGEDQRTPDLKDLITAIITKEDWEAGNAIAFFLEGTGRRVAESAGAFDAGQSPTLVIEATIPPAAPEVVEEIPNISVRSGWAFSLDVRRFFKDLDSELNFTATGGLRGEELPSGVTFTDGIISGSISEVGFFTIEITATEDEDTDPQSISDAFGIAVEPDVNRFIEPVATVTLGTFDEGAAEISAYDAGSKRLFVTNAESDALNIIDITDPSEPEVIDTIDISTYGGGINSVAVYDGLVALAIEAETKQDNGTVVVFDTDGAEQWTVTAGALPDMVTFNEDGTKIIVANEGEPSDDYTVDPEGTITIIDVATEAVEFTANFNAFDGQEATLEADGVRIFGPNASVSEDLEPEYITVVGDSAYVTLQENNAIAIVDITSGTVDDIIGLGFKDHSVAGNGLDVPETDEVYISTWPFKGMYQPDAIAGYEVGGTTYLITANEGDAREYEFDNNGVDEISYTDETSIEDIELDTDTFSNAEQIQEFAGGLKISTANADTTAEGKYSTLYTFGTRSFSIWNASTGDQVYDSGDDLEQITASIYPENFNASNSNFNFKNRSDDKGPEPEAVAIGEIDGTTYAFVGLERIGGIAIYDVTDPASPEFIEYFNNRNFDAADDESPEAGDSGPEGIVFISADDSPEGQALLVVSNEVSGTVTIYTIGEVSNPFSLSIFHNNDGESALLADTVEVNGVDTPVGAISQFVSTLDSLRDQASDRGFESLMLSSGDNILPGQTFNASNANGVFYDAISLDSIAYDAICIGNHDFDFGTGVLAEFIEAFETNQAPYLTANLGFENVPELQALVDAGRIASSTIVTKGGEEIGIVGLTTPEITIISSPGNTEVSDAIVDSAQAAIDDLIDQGVNKIILISHLQGLDEDAELIPQLTGVDIVIAGGGDELLTNDPNLGNPFSLSPKGEYPLVEQDADGNDVYVVTTPGNYRFLGNLAVDFDDEGNVIRVFDSNPVLVTGDANQDLIDNVETPIREYIDDLVTNVIAVSEVDLDFRKEQLRTGETNAGNLFADALLWQAKQTHEDFGVAEPTIALQNGGGLRIERIIEAGDFNENLTYEIAAFTNIVSVVEEVSPEKLLELIEHGVEDAPSSNGRFPQIAGFEIVYDLGFEPGSRVISITLDDDTQIVAEGAVVDGAPNVNLVTIDFIAGGGDGYPFGDMSFTTLGATYQQALLNYLTDENGLDSLITEEQYPLGMNERILVETTPIEAIDEVVTNFDNSCPDLPEGWVEYNEGEDLISCGGSDNTYIDFNGFGVGAGTSWAISPRVDFDGSAYVLSVDYVHRFSGPLPEVLYSTDYLGYGDPNDATWTTLTSAEDTLHVGTESNDFVHVDNIDLSGITEAAAIAFKYTSDGSGSGESIRFRIDNFYVNVPSSDLSESFTELFDTQIPDNWVEYNSGVDLVTYFSNDQYVDFNGFGNGAGLSWLVTEKVSYGSADYEMSFDHVRRFSGPDAEVVYSTDYPGYGNPAFFTWEVLSAATDSANVETSSNDFVNTGAIDISEITEDAYVAFRYTSEGDQGGQSLRFRIDSVVVQIGNNYPTNGIALEDLMLDEGFGTQEVDLSNAFADADGDDLTYTVMSSDESIATVAASGTTLTITEVAIGTTTITVTADDGSENPVSDEFELVINKVTGVNDGLLKGLVHFPNPAQDFIHLSHNSLNIEEVRIYSIEGQLVSTTKLIDNTLDISSLQNGIYMIKLVDKSAGQTLVTRIIKE